MAKNISIGIASETREYATGISRGVIEPTQDALDALEQVGKAGDHAGDQLQDGMRTAQRGTEQLQGDIKALSTQVKDASSSSRKIGTDFKHSTDEASEGVKTLKENTGQNLKEVAASFDGTAQGAASGIQGLVAEVLEGFGPGGLVAGAVVAGGIGLLMSGIEDADTQTQAFREDVSSLAQSWIAAGRNGSIGAQQIADQLEAMATQSDNSKVSLADVEAQAKSLGIPFRELAQVYARGGDATQYALDRTDKLIAAERERITVTLAGSRAGAGPAARENEAAAERIHLLEQQRSKLVGVQKETAAAAKEEQEWIAAGGPDLQQKAQDTQAYADSVQAALQQAGGDWQDYKTKEGGVNLAAYEKGLRAKIKATQDYQSNVSELARMGNADALGYIESLGADAAPLLQQFVDAPKSQQNRLIRLWASLGKDASSSFNTALQDGIPGSINGPKINAPDAGAYLDAVGSVHRAAQYYLDSHPLTAAFSTPSRYGKLAP